MSDAGLEADLRAALQAFLDAIDAADRERLAPLWCADGSMYFPFRNTLELVEGAPAVLARFDKMFEDLRARLPEAPYIRFSIDHFRVQPLDAFHAVIYTTLGFQGQVGRRTILCRREAAGWAILHVHASNFGGT